MAFPPNRFASCFENIAKRSKKIADNIDRSNIANENNVLVFLDSNPVQNRRREDSNSIHFS